MGFQTRPIQNVDASGSGSEPPARIMKVAGHYPFMFRGYEGKGDWKSASAAMGNPEPTVDPPIDLKRL
jgi:hypothetical protein